MVKFDCWRTRKPRALRDAVQAEQPSMHRDEERQTRRFNNRALKRRLGLAASLFALSSGACLQPVSAQSSEVEQTGERGSENWFTDLTQEMSPSLVALLGAGALAAASLAWGARTSAGTRRTMASWSKKLATMEAELDDTRAVLSAYRGLILIWADDQSDAAIDEAWGEPRLLGGAAALASLMSFAGSDGNGETAIARLLNAIGDLDLFDAHTNEPAPLKKKVSALRQHGVPFAGVIRTTEGRSIEAEGVVAGGQVTLWLADPATKVAESGDLLGSARQNAEDLHGALHLLQNTPVPAWRRSGDGRIIWANTAYLEAVEAKSLSVVCNDQIELDSAVRRLAEKARVDRTAVEAPVSVNVSGERKIFRVTEQPTHTGEDAGLCGMALDITELEATRTTLTEHIETNRRTLDQIPVAVAIFGVNTELSYYNLAFKELWGLETAELDAKPPHGEVLDKLRHNGRLPEQADYRGWRAKQLEIYTEETPPGVDRTGAAPDEVWSLADGRTLRVARARHPLGGLVIVFEDITEKLRFEALHNTQIKVQRATLNNLSEGVATFGADGRLRLANDSFRQLWRMDESFLSKLPHVEAVLKRMRAFTADGGEALNLVRRRITSMTAEDRTSTSEQQLALTDGRTLSFGTEPLPDGATLIHFLDVTDSCEREKELKERNAFLEDIDRQKSKFIDHVSYQLRTPLNTIIGFSEMLDGEMFGVLNERQKDYVASVLSAAYSLKDLISDIMDLAAIDAGKVSLEETDVNIRELLTNAAAHAALKAEDTQISLKVTCADDIGSIQADDRRLKQVLFNLLSNAFAYTGSGGEVTLSADRAPGLIRIWVEDTGRGVSPEDQAKAFNAFEASGPSAGAGLGLALVQRFVNLHNGWVRMESAPAKGTRVTLFLPSSKSESPQPDAPQPPDLTDAEGRQPSQQDKAAGGEKKALVKRRAPARQASLKTQRRIQALKREAAE